MFSPGRFLRYMLWVGPVMLQRSVSAHQASVLEMMHTGCEGVTRTTEPEFELKQLHMCRLFSLAENIVNI
jgi:hypothetical protein